MLRLLGVRIFYTAEKKNSKKLALGALKIVPKRARRHRASPLAPHIVSTFTTSCSQLLNIRCAYEVHLDWAALFFQSLLRRQLLL